jgi:hypothetical protein
MHTVFFLEHMKGRMDLREIGREGVYWVHLPHNKDRWKAVVNTVMNLRFP